MEDLTPQNPQSITEPSPAATASADNDGDQSLPDRVFAWIESHFAIVAPAVLLLLTLVVFWNALRQDKLIFGNGTDMVAFTVPCYSFLDREFHRGNIPTWNPHCFGGYPLAGNINVGMFYPLSWFHYFLPMVRACNIMAAVHVFLAGWFMALWCRKRRLRTLSCIFGGIVFMFGGPFFMHVFVGHPAVIAASAFIPLIFLSVDGLLEARDLRGSLGWFLLGSLVLGLQILTGFAQLVYYTGLIGSVYLVLCTLTSHRPWKRRLQTLLLCGGFCVAGAAIAAVVLLPGMAMKTESIRANGITEQDAGECSVPPEMFVSLIAPDFWGDEQSPNPYVGRQIIWELSLFLGCSGLLLAAYGAIAGDWSKRRFTFSLLVIALVMAVGNYIPWLYHFLFKYLPGYANLRTPSRWNELYGLFMAMLAALGLDQLTRQKRSPLWLPIAGIVLGLAVLFFSDQIKTSAGDPHGSWAQTLDWLASLGKELPWLGNEHARGAFVRTTGLFAGQQMMWAALSLLAAGLAIALGQLAPKWAYAVVLIAAVEMAVFARHSVTLTSGYVSYPSVWASELGKLAGQDLRAYHYSLGYANCGMVGNYDDIFGYDPVCTLRYAQFLAYLFPMDPAQLSFAQAPNVLEDDRAAEQALNRPIGKVRITTPVDINYLHARHPINALPFLQMLRCAMVMKDAENLRYILPVVAVNNPMPHVALITDWKVVPDLMERLEKLTSVDFNPRRQVILESAPRVGGSPEVDNSESFARVLSSSTDWLEIEVQTGGAMLLVTDAYANGWNVKPIGSAPQSQYQVMPANQILRAIPLKAGHHHFRLEYSAPGYAAGKVLSSAALLAWLVGAGILLVLRRGPSIQGSPGGPAGGRLTAG